MAQHRSTDSHAASLLTTTNSYNVWLDSQFFDEVAPSRCQAWMAMGFNVLREDGYLWEWKTGILPPAEEVLCSSSRCTLQVPKRSAVNYYYNQLAQLFWAWLTEFFEEVAPRRCPSRMAMGFNLPRVDGEGDVRWESSMEQLLFRSSCEIALVKIIKS